MACFIYFLGSGFVLLCLEVILPLPGVSEVGGPSPSFVVAVLVVAVVALLVVVSGGGGGASLSKIQKLHLYSQVGKISAWKIQINKHSMWQHDESKTSGCGCTIYLNRLAVAFHLPRGWEQVEYAVLQAICKWWWLNVDTHIEGIINTSDAKMWLIAPPQHAIWFQFLTGKKTPPPIGTVYLYDSENLLTQWFFNLL